MLWRKHNESTICDASAALLFLTSMDDTMTWLTHNNARTLIAAWK